MGNFLYNFIIRPLFLFFEFVFVKAYALTGNYGFTIICLSLVVNFLILPLYRRADAIQAEAREKEKELSYWVDHIKKTFKGDERYMLLTTYYRQNNYKQTDSLKSTISLFLQIPFFIAAYRFLSGLQELQGVSFGPIANLGAPDEMLQIGGLAINVLPILMSVMNILSGAVYGKDLPLKSKIQMYGIAAVFLVLLYRSPAGLVFYWTLNNVFSLIKNLIVKSKYKNQILIGLSFFGGALLLLLFFVVHPAETLRRKLLIVGIALVLFAFGFYKKLHAERNVTTEPDIAKPSRALYVFPVIYLTILIGVLIPSAVVSSSPAEFIDQTNYQNPLIYVYYTAIIAAGVFVGWMTVFYMMASNKIKHWIVCILWILSGVFTVNYMFFGKNLGILSSDLVYNEAVVFTRQQQLVNLGVIILLALIMYFIIKKIPKAVPAIYLAMCFGVVFLTGMNVNANQKQLGKMVNYLKENIQTEASIPLSTTGKNVVVLMLDRCIGAYLPYLFNEKPELQEQFAGFTYYPNTVSLGTATNTGSAALFGGYEYSPYYMNLRSDELLKDKHDEALKVLPVLFSENDFVSSVFDPPYAGYTWIPDLSIYDDYPEINAYHTIGKYDKELKAAKKSNLQRNFFCFSIFKVMPLALQKIVYNEGNYNNTSDVSTDYTEDFMDNYTVLTNLPNITDIREDDTNTFMIMENKTPHEPCVLQLPEYVPVAHVDNGTYDQDHSDRFTLNGITLKTDTQWRKVHYYAEMAALLQVGNWLDYLRENNVYDNTRIIIVSDHGYGLGQFSNMFTAENVDTEWFDPILLVKDFDSTEYSVCDAFMTNADTPLLAMEGLIEDPVNPFTGQQMNASEKEGELIVFHTTRWGVNDNNGNVFKDDDSNRWLTVKENRLDMDNWTLIEDPTK